MGYTHHDKVCGVNGLFAGAKGSEVQIATSAGVLTGTVKADAIYKDTAGTVMLSSKECTQSLIVTQSSTATQSWYICAPVKGNLVNAWSVYTVANATCGTFSISMGTAGDNLAALTGGTATVGSIFALTLSATVAVTAAQLLKMTYTAATTGIQNTYLGVVMVWDKT